METGREATPRGHYENLLADHYTWMFGVPFADKVAEQRQLLEQLGALPARRHLALDLGAGSGFQSLALSGLGFEQIVAVDVSPKLLAELAGHQQGKAITTVEADLNDYLASTNVGTADLIVCMGDTLTHLATKAEVTRLITSAAKTLTDAGVLVLTYRDLSVEVFGPDRFIPVASDVDRILTCFLDYQADTVLVHDLLYERNGTTWRLRTSAYRKLRLASAWVEAELRAAGFKSVEQKPAGRLKGLVARKT